MTIGNRGYEDTEQTSFLTIEITDSFDQTKNL